ncbi:TIGR01777 family protein [Legionella jordanis]|uniref:TIGR01777 family oxidoreductase n=1 Tax=Legionella jordanis TaxID=456 RepID=UPI000F00F06C|nr:TIGR01777 family oxidoreductase [Legionella jordanis]RMX22075.1 TIGR01777 family protein [Legionella jordanis]
MKILIAGASGFIGAELVKHLVATQQITVIGRSQAKLQKQFGNTVESVTWQNLTTLDAKSFDAVINLSGYNIGASRWTKPIKQLIIDSRVDTTQQLIDWLIKQQAKPRFFCANALSIYGVQDNSNPMIHDEISPVNLDHPENFLHEVSVKWQRALNPGIEYGMKVIMLRFAVVLKRDQGMLKKLLPSFKLGLGSVLGDGKQTISWVHFSDLVSAIEFLLLRPELTGPFNIVAPQLVSQKEFANNLAKCLHRPRWLKTPGFLIRFLFGEMGEFLLLKGQRAQPRRLTEAGFCFRYPELKMALEQELCTDKVE